MVLSKSELISALQHETRILSHLATKVEPSMLDYRPTPKQRSTLEWFQYMSMMGKQLAIDGRAGAFNPEAWTAEEKAAFARSFDETVAAIKDLGEFYAKTLGEMSDEDFRKEVTFFGTTQSLGGFFVNTILAGHAAYRTQIFLYLKSCGRTDLNTMNLWAGMDAPAP
jgi:hypothetical protein